MRMKRILFLILSLLLFPLASRAQEIPIAPYLPAEQTIAAQTNAPITVQFPQENMKIAREAQNIFIFGHLHFPNPQTLDINGQDVPLHPSGSFLAYVPVKIGVFPLILTASDGTNTYQSVRHIYVRGRDIRDFSEKASFDETETFPQREVELIPGDTIDLYVRATPQAKVEVTLSGLKHGKNILLTEDSSSPGSYRGQFTIDPEQKPKTAKVVYKLENGPRRSKAKITAPGKIKVRGGERLFTCAQITHPGIKVRKLPTSTGNLHPHYRAYGTVMINGKMNNQLRIWLNDQEAVWLESEKLKEVSCPASVGNSITGIQTEAFEDRTRIVVESAREVPFQIQEFKDRIEVQLYYVDKVNENFSIDNTSPVLENVVWSQPTPDTLLLKLYTRKNTRLWGYTYRFNEGNLEVDLMHTPVLTPTPKAPLKGARILIDAGHNPKRTAPYDGAVGPTGYLEYEGAMALAEELKQALEKEGAQVILTRRGNNRMTLQQRYEHALLHQAHIFVSLHYNAFPETVNPLARPHGFQVYYTYPHSFDLARRVYESYIKYVPLPDNGLIANDVLFIPRISDMPSILVESAYLMFPEQEEMARTKEGRAKMVMALKTGILNFFKQISSH